MSEQPEAPREGRHGLLALYDEALAHVFGYMLSRSGDRALAEDLTADTFLAAATAVRSGSAPVPTPAWLTGIARHKLADHGRRVEREHRALLRVYGGEPQQDDPWDVRIDWDGPMDAGRELGTVPVYRVEDVDAAVVRVRAAGGRAFDP